MGDEIGLAPNFLPVQRSRDSTSGHGSALMRGSKTISFMPNACPACATRLPTLPKPIIPRVLLNNSEPMNLFLSHLPAFIEASAAGTLRHRAKIKAMVCSAALAVFPSGELRTKIPASVAAAISMLSTPTPALQTAFNFLPRSITSAVTFVSAAQPTMHRTRLSPRATAQALFPVHN